MDNAGIPIRAWGAAYTMQPPRQDWNRFRLRPGRLAVALPHVRDVLTALRGQRRAALLMRDHFAFGLGCHSASVAPVGSVKIENHPIPMTSVTSLITVAPSERALAVAALTSSTST